MHTQSLRAEYRTRMAGVDSIAPAMHALIGADGDTSEAVDAMRDRQERDLLAEWLERVDVAAWLADQQRREDYESRRQAGLHLDGPTRTDLAVIDDGESAHVVLTAWHEDSSDDDVSLAKDRGLMALPGNVEEQRQVRRAEKPTACAVYRVNDAGERELVRVDEPERPKRGKRGRPRKSDAELRANAAERKRRERARKVTVQAMREAGMALANVNQHT